MGKFPKGWYKTRFPSPQHAFDFFRSQGKFHKGKLEPDLYIVVVDGVIGYIVKKEGKKDIGWQLVDYIRKV